MESNSNHGDEGSNTVECSSIPTLYSNSSKRQKKSNVWTVFDMLDPEEQLTYQVKYKDTKERAKCKFCGTVMIGFSHSGMSTMRRHIETCKKIDRSTESTQSEGVCGTKKIDPSVAREMLVESVIAHGYPFKIVEDAKLRAFHSYLNDQFKPICRNTCKADCLKLHKKMKEKVKSDLEKISSRICLTADMWTSCTTDGYLCLTAHFVDDNWKLRSLILNFQHVPPPQTAFSLYNKIYDLLKEWGIDRKIFSITLDNASNMDNMQRHLCSLLDQQGALLCHGKYFHIRCAAHILNLVVQKGLSVIDDALKKIRESLKYVEGSEARKIKFQECVLQSNLNYSRSLWLDVATRWNSTYLMLEKFLYFREAFEKLKVLDGNYNALLSPQEFLWIENVFKFLKPFYEITTLFSGRDYLTSNLYFEIVWQIQKNIQNMLVSEDEIMKLMAMEMNEKFCKYWDDYTRVLSFGAILDPRFKLQLLQFVFAKLGVEYEIKWMDILEEMKLLFKEYENQNNLFSQSFMMTRDKDQSKRRNIFEDLSGFRTFNTGSLLYRSELDIYLNESREDYEIQINVLDYWKKNQFRYPVLSLMAKDILSIPITTVASESTFSMSGRVINKWRNCLTTHNAEILITTRNWLYGYDIDQDDEEDETMGFGRNVGLN